MLRRLSFALIPLLAVSATAQSVISAHSGVIQYVEGQVTLEGKTVQPKFAEFPDVKPGETLAAEDGRAEILLTPGVFLRIAENSSFKMVANQLSDTRIEVLSGSALVEVGELLADNAIQVQFHDAQIALSKNGLYRVDAEPGLLRVYQGEAKVTSGSQTLVAKKGHQVRLDGELVAQNFDTKQTDAFYRWSERRDEYVAQANIVSAKSTGASGSSWAGAGYGSGYGGSGYGGCGYSSFGYSSLGCGYDPSLGSWAWNPWFGMFTYVPMTGMYYSPFGYAYYSPLAAAIYYPMIGSYYGGVGGVNPNSYNAIHPVTTAASSSSIVARSSGLASSSGFPSVGAGRSGGSVSSVSGGGGGHAGGGGGHR